MRNICFVFTVILSVFTTFSQLSSHADQLFDNFDYQAAARSYESSSNLNLDQQFNLLYCYFVEMNAERGLTLAQNYLKNKSINTEVWLWKAHFERALGQFDTALESHKTYKNFGGNQGELGFENSCRLWMEGKAEWEGQLFNTSNNNAHADWIVDLNGTKIRFKEIGLDSLKNAISTDEGEVFLLRPFVMEQDEQMEWLFLDEKARFFSVNSIAYDGKNQQVIFAASDPVSANKNEMLSHIYVGRCEGIGKPISGVKPWVYSGFEDSTFCSHVALHSNGNELAFAKVAKGKLDADIYISYLESNQWSYPENITMINTTGNELFPSFLGDSLFTFSSDGRIGYGGLDLYYVRTSEKKVIGHFPLPINSVSDDFFVSYEAENQLHFVSNRFGGKGDDDVWKFTRNQPVVAIPEPEPIVEVIVPLPVENKFDLEAFLQECNSKKIYFDFNQGGTEEQFDFVQKLKELIDNGAKFSILVSGYADARGNNQANYQIGLKRAESVKKDLISKGIPATMLIVKSEGSSKITGKCQSPTIPCSEEEHRLNRFVQLTVVPKY